MRARFALATPGVCLLCSAVPAKDSRKLGDRVSVDGSRAKDGSNTANAQKVIHPDGRRVFGGSSADANAQQ